jgi:hypothetical protein
MRPAMWSVEFTDDLVVLGRKWSKSAIEIGRAQQERMEAAVDQAKKGSLPPPHGVRVYSSCGEWKNEGGCSNTQWKKVDRRCKACLDLSSASPAVLHQQIPGRLQGKKSLTKHLTCNCEPQTLCSCSLMLSYRGGSCQKKNQPLAKNSRPWYLRVSCVELILRD